MTECVAVFGGSFNPPHVGHVLVASYLLAMMECDRVLVVPCFRHPFGKSLAPFEVRLQMCEAAFGWMPRVEISTVERDLGGESRTLRTLRHIADAHPGWSLRLVIGTDVVQEAPRWYGFDEVEKLA
ncbi:MAG: nicotinate-nicotinamide nucleotide adenylyltransferase, partial [Polyangiaceae bacterium]|nr:nicotinate-nicotinamide nucleotide adenylyltransferase [Polyangiaceae bacterium]